MSDFCRWPRFWLTRIFIWSTLTRIHGFRSGASRRYDFFFGHRFQGDVQLPEPFDMLQVSEQYVEAMKELNCDHALVSLQCPSGTAQP